MGDRPRSNLSRIADILGAFDAANRPRSASDLVASLRLGRSTGFALIKALVEAGWLTRLKDGSLTLGGRAAALMRVPLEPSLAFTDDQATLAAPSPGQDPGMETSALFDDWQEDLLTPVETSGFLRQGSVRIGFANASLSNPWRIALLESMAAATRLHGDQINSFMVETADDDPDRQREQIDDLVQRGIDLLVVSCTNVIDAKLSDQLGRLAAAGLPIIAVDRRPSDLGCLVSFVTASDRRIGRISALWLRETLGADATIWMLSGLAGTSPARRRLAAAEAVFAALDGPAIVARADTDWTPAGGYAAIDRLLADGHKPPDGVWCDSGLQGEGALRRFLENGTPPPVHTGGDLNGMYKLALQHRVPFVAVDYPAAMGARAIEVAMDVLAGRPVRRRVEVMAPIVLPRGAETLSVNAERWAELHVAWNLPDGIVLSQGPGVRTTAQARIERTGGQGALYPSYHSPDTGRVGPDGAAPLEAGRSS